MKTRLTVCSMQTYSICLPSEISRLMLASMTLILVSCGVGAPSSIDSTNADSFLETVNALVQDEPESTRQEFGQDLLLIYQSTQLGGDIPRPYSRSLFPEDFQSVFRSGGSAQASDIVLTVGGLLDGKSISQVHSLADTIRVDTYKKERSLLLDQIVVMSKWEKHLDSNRMHQLSRMDKITDKRPIVNGLVTEFGGLQSMARLCEEELRIAQQASLAAKDALALMEELIKKPQQSDYRPLSKYREPSSKNPNDCQGLLRRSKTQ